MFSNNFVPQIVATSALILTLTIISKAQTNSIGEAWKNSSTPSSQNNSNNQSNNSSAKSETGTKNIDLKQSLLGGSDQPVEPKVQPMNPALVLEAEVTEIKSTKFDLPRDEAIVGIEPPVTYNATAYSLTGKTRSGTKVRRGVIAADPRVLPLGSVVHLKAGNYSGLYTVHDTGAAVKGKHIDVWVPSSREARSFGRQNVRLTVLKYGGNRKPTSKR